MQVTHMSKIEINCLVLKFDFAKSNSLAAEPVAVLDLVNISIHRPMMEERREDWMLAEDA